MPQCERSQLELSLTFLSSIAPLNYLELTGCCARARDFGVAAGEYLHAEPTHVTFHRPTGILTGMLTFAMCVVAGGEFSCESNSCVTFHRPVEMLTGAMCGVWQVVSFPANRTHM